MAPRLLCLLAWLLSTHGVNMYPGLRPTQVRLGSSFKWGEGNAPRWTGVFMASNDAVPILDVALESLASLPRERRALVTVVGGMKYLDIMGRVEFSEVHFFDMNINELTKLRLVHGDIVAKDYDAWVAAGAMTPATDAILRDADEFFLPRALHGAGVTLAPDASHEWPTHDADFRGLFDERDGGVSRRAASLYTMFAPHKWPEYQWRPTREQYERVRRQLTNPTVVADIFHMRLPAGLVAPHKFVAVYLDGVDYKYCQLHEVRAVSRSGLALGIYSTSLFKEGVRAAAAAKGVQLVSDSTDWENAHFFWDAAVRMHALGRPECPDRIASAPAPAPLVRGSATAESAAGAAQAPWRQVLHIWAPEDAAFAGSVYDWAFTWGISADQLMASAAKQAAVAGEMDGPDAAAALARSAALVIGRLNCSTVVLHMLLGKAASVPSGRQDQAASVVAEDGTAAAAAAGEGTQQLCATRRQLFDDVLGAALRAPTTVRVLVTEHNADATTNAAIAAKMVARGTPQARVQFDRTAHPCVLGRGDIERVAAEVAARVASVNSGLGGTAGMIAARRFSVTHSRVLPGNWAADRNALVVLDAEGEVETRGCDGTGAGSVGGCGGGGGGPAELDSPALSVDVNVRSGGGFGHRSNPNPSAMELLAFPADAGPDTRYALAAGECFQMGIQESNCVVAIDEAMTREQRKYEGERTAAREYNGVRVPLATSHAPA